MEWQTAIVATITFLTGVVFALLMVNIKADKNAYEAGYEAGHDDGYSLCKRFGEKK